MTDSQQRIARIVKSVSTVDSVEPSAGELLFDAGIIDSFGLADLVGALETEFQVSVPEADLRPSNFRSIEAIDVYLQSLKP